LLDAADVDTKVVRYDGMIHGFLGMRELVPAANEAMAETAAFLRTRLA
jgi:acetyl esterase/lipase